MKYIIYTILAIFGLALFLPEPGTTEIRNLPIFIFVVSFIAVYIIYRTVRLALLMRKIKKATKSAEMTIQKSRLSIGNGYIIAKNNEENICITFLVRKRKFCRHHFASEKVIEYYKTSAAMVRSSKRGTFAKGASETRKVGEIELCDIKNELEFSKSFIVIDKMPDTVTDYKLKGGLFDGDFVGDSGVIFISAQKFSELIKK